MKSPALMLPIILASYSLFSQKISYSDFDQTDFARYKFDVITRVADKIIIYKAFLQRSTSAAYYGASGNPLLGYVNSTIPSDPVTPIERSSIRIYNPEMQLQEEIPIDLPRDITGVHFLLKADYFLMFYQYLKGHRVYCMAAKFGFDGKIAGPPFEMDHTDVIDIRYQSQIYTVVYSENKKFIVAFKDQHNEATGFTISRLLFNENLQLQNTVSNFIPASVTEHLSEFKVDNGGNFIFVGNSGSASKDERAKMVLFVQKPDTTEMGAFNINPKHVFADDVRVVIDNKRDRYSLVSFFSVKPQSDIKGLYNCVFDKNKEVFISDASIAFSDSLKAIFNSSNLITALNNLYIQQVQLRSDGGLVTEMQELASFNTAKPYNRWNYLDYFPQWVSTDYVFYDPYQYDHYYPWKEFAYYANKVNLNSSKAAFISTDSVGKEQWTRIIRTEVDDILRPLIGMKTLVISDLIYVLFNEKIKHKTFLTVQTINSRGEINTDPRFREDLMLSQLRPEYNHFPRFAKQIGANELILPCRKNNGYTCLAHIEF